MICFRMIQQDIRGTEQHWVGSSSRLPVLSSAHLQHRHDQRSSVLGWPDAGADAGSAVLESAPYYCNCI